MKRIVSLFIALTFLFNTTIAYTLKVTVKGIDLVVTREYGNVIELEAKAEDIIGWEVKKGNITITDNSFVMPEEDVEIEAIIAKELGTYSLVVETPFITRRENKIEGQSVTVEATSTEEYIFVNWNATGIVLTEAQKTSETITFTMPGNDVTLVANYQEVLQQYTIAYDANGGSGAPSAQIKTEGQALILSTVEPIKEGYDFLGWATSSTATEAEYIGEEEFLIDSDTTLFAVWRIGETNTLASGASWYTLGGTSISKSSITSIDIKDSYTPQSYIETWDASSKQDNTVLVYIEDDGSGNGTYKLTLAGNGAGKIYANKNSFRTFYGFSNVTSINGFNAENDNVIFDTSRTTMMYAMFSECSSLTSIDLSGFDTSVAADMGGMFNDCSSLTGIQLSNFDTSEVTKMATMFAGCSSLTNLDLSGFDTSKVTTMYAMFSECSDLETLTFGTDFDTSEVTDMGTMFSGCSKLASIGVSGFNTSKVAKMASMFAGCSSLTSLDLSGFDTSKVTTMYAMFSECSNLETLTFGTDFDTSEVTDMGTMFSGCSKLASIGVSGFNTSKVAKMSAMFAGCSSLTGLDLSGFETSNVTTMYAMFSACSNLETLTFGAEFDTSEVTDMGSMFSGCSKLASIGISSFNTSKVTKTAFMFDACTSLIELNVSNFDTSNVTNMYGMFGNCWNLERVNVGGNFNTSEVTDMGAMFSECNSLTEIVGIGEFNTSKAKKMALMFKGCSSLTELNLSNFNTSSVTDMGTMFGGCTNLTELNVSGFDTSSVVSLSTFAINCPNLQTIVLGSNFGQSTNVQSAGAFYSSSNVVTTVSGANDVMLAYSWADDNRTVSFAN